MGRKLSFEPVTIRTFRNFSFNVLETNRRRWTSSKMAVPLEWPANPRFKPAEEELRHYYWQVLTDQERKGVHHSALSYLVATMHNVTRRWWGASAFSYNRGMTYLCTGTSYTVRSLQTMTSNSFHEIEDGKLCLTSMTPDHWQWDRTSGLGNEIVTMVEWQAMMRYWPAFWRKTYPRLVVRAVRDHKNRSENV